MVLSLLVANGIEFKYLTLIMLKFLGCIFNWGIQGDFKSFYL